MKKVNEVVVKQVEPAVQTEVLAAAIVALSASAQKMLNGGLNTRTIALLLNDDLAPKHGLTRAKIEVVLEALPMDEMSTFAKGFFAIEDVLQGQREQRESVKGKPTPFRVEFRFGRGHSSYQYFETYEDASKAECRSCSYGPFGSPIIRHPRSQQIQVKGPRGGWKRFTEAL